MIRGVSQGESIMGSTSLPSIQAAIGVPMANYNMADGGRSATTENDLTRQWHTQNQKLTRQWRRGSPHDLVGDSDLSCAGQITLDFFHRV
jgi:hypothetical protein